MIFLLNERHITKVMASFAANKTRQRRVQNCKVGDCCWWCEQAQMIDVSLSQWERLRGVASSAWFRCQTNSWRWLAWFSANGNAGGGVVLSEWRCYSMNSWRCAVVKRSSTIIRWCELNQLLHSADSAPVADWRHSSQRLSRLRSCQNQVRSVDF